ncbi:MAG: MFS transporter [Deltaproteobacteria bacterium HGW-Deltaproteobacteria-14]|jgi:EmrB/QacA subfamily drug resistance transporter|nr:MAG: MFS transporter [Deltaproteobacteria bacterium HGW-Deltaproteobacteria-14]
MALATLLSSLGTSVANVALPELARAFGASFQAVQWVVLAYLLAITAAIVTAGRLGDLVGRRRLLRIGLYLYTAASALCGLAPSLWLVIAARALQGLGAAAMMALTMAFVSELVPKGRIGGAMGLLGTTSAIGTALGPSLGGLLIDQVGWPAVFLINLPLGLLAVALTQRHLPADPPRPNADRTGFDHRGTLLLAGALTAYALAMTLGRGRFGALNAALLVAAALGLALLLRTERRAPSPLIHLATFRDPALTASLAANLLISTVMMATLVVGPFHLSLALHLEPGSVGLALSAGPLVSMVTGVPAGRLVDRLGAERVSLAGLGGAAAGALLLAFTPEALGVAGYIGPIAVVTVGYAMFQAANNTAVMREVAPARRGVVAGILSLSRNLGLITGASVMGAVFALATGAGDLTSAPPAAVAAGTRVTFAVAAGLVGLALAVTVLGRALASRRALTSEAP